MKRAGNNPAKYIKQAKHFKIHNEEKYWGKNAVSHVNIKVIQSPVMELKRVGHDLAPGQQHFASNYEETGAGMHSMEIEFEVVTACF